MTAELLLDGPGHAPKEAHPAYRALVERLFSLSRGGTKFGLAPMTRLLAALGHPERAFRAAHVAGSNGKGSTTAFLATMLGARGDFVGMYTSPHLVSMTERIQFLRGVRPASAVGASSAPDRWEIDESAMVEAVRAIETAIPALEGLSFFEVITGAAFHAFRTSGVDVAVIEAGLGARLDATRLAEADVAVLTDLSLEHTAILGDSIEAIAREEGAVVRPGRPLVCADGPATAMQQVDALAQAADAPVYRLGRDFGVTRMQDGRFELELTDRTLGPVQLALLGLHQGRNAALAAQAAVLMSPTIDDAALLTGLTQARWPGRMEVVRRADLPPILLDGAQNAHATRALVEALRVHRTRFSGPLHFVFGVMTDKDAGDMVGRLAPWARTFTVTRPQSVRARDPLQVAAMIPPGPAVHVEPSIERAVQYAVAQAEQAGGWVVVCGSLYLIGDVRALLAVG